ncbi:unnamed protein product [Diamesa serratosioi]
MVFEAISFLENPKGSSVQAIKKLMTMKLQVDCVHLAPFIKKVLKSGVKDGQLEQLKLSYKISKKRVRKTSTLKNKKSIKPVSS